jgi:hypothetical protein
MRYAHPDEADVLEIAVQVARSKRTAVTTILTTAGQQESTEARKM